MDEEKDFHYTGYFHGHLEASRSFRKNMTPAERRLWYDYCCPSQWRFYRQRPIDRFIVDFYCSKAKLVIELDGAPHFTTDGHQYDVLRSDMIERYGLRVVRFTNRQVLEEFSAVCASIDSMILSRVSEQ